MKVRCVYPRIRPEHAYHGLTDGKVYEVIHPLKYNPMCAAIVDDNGMQRYIDTDGSLSAHMWDGRNWNKSSVGRFIIVEDCDVED